MAIDWGRVAMGVGTGYLSAKIVNTEAHDKMNGEIQKAAGINFHTNTYLNLRLRYTLLHCSK